MGFNVVGKVNGTSCALTSPSIGEKVENGSCNGADGALGICGLPALHVPALKLAPFELLGTTLSITPFPFTSLLGC